MDIVESILDDLFPKESIKDLWADQKLLSRIQSELKSQQDEF